MNEFKADCTINLHVELSGKPAKVAWACSLVHARRGRVVLARKFLGIVPREEAELEVLQFGLRQATRLLQEKVELNATFPLEGKLSAKKSAKLEPSLKEKKEQLARLWDGFRLKRAARMSGEEAKLLRETAEKTFVTKRSH